MGFSAAFLNPFNVGIAQGIAGVPIFSGIGYRLIVWAIATAVSIVFLMWYAARIKRHPEKAPPTCSTSKSAASTRWTWTALPA